MRTLFEIIWPRRCRLRVLVCAVVVMLALVPSLCAMVLDARYRASISPHVSVFGNGCPSGFGYEIAGSGEPSEEVEHLVARAVNSWVEQRRPVGIIPRSRGLTIRAPRLTSILLGKLHTYPRDESLPLYVWFDVEEVAPGGFAALEALTNVEELTLGPEVRGLVPPRRALYWTITNSEMERVAKLTELHALGFVHVELTDSAVEVICDMQNLKSISLSDVKVSPSGLARIHAFRNLGTLQIETASSEVD